MKIDIEIPVARVFAPLQQQARFKAAFGGRGSGKSWFWAGEAVIALLEGKSIVCIREIQNSIADSVKRLIEARIAEFGLSHLFKITDREITCPHSGGVSIFRGMQNHTADSIKSLEGFEIAWWAEAQTASQRALDLLMPTIRAANSELWFDWNPDSENDPIDIFLRQNPPEGAIVVEANWNNNPWFPKELRADMERDRSRDPDKCAHVWDGAYTSQSEARIFRNWRIGDMDPPENVVWHYGADWGFSVDPNAGIRCCIPEPGTLYIDSEVYEVGTPMESLPVLFSGLTDAEKWPMRADSARPETIDFMRRHGFPKIRAAKKGAGSIMDGITFLQSYDIVVGTNCANTAREFGRYAYKTDPRTGEVLPAINDRDNHLIDALRYATEGLHIRGVVLKGDEGHREKTRHLDYGIDDDEDQEASWKVV